MNLNNIKKFNYKHLTIHTMSGGKPVVKEQNGVFLYNAQDIKDAMAFIELVEWNLKEVPTEVKSTTEDLKEKTEAVVEKATEVAKKVLPKKDEVKDAKIEKPKKAPLNAATLGEDPKVEKSFAEKMAEAKKKKAAEKK